MSEWKQAAARRRDERNAKPDDAPTPGASERKNTKRWCRGKIGVEHQAECRGYNETKRQGLARHSNSWRVLVCSECGKELKTWYGTKSKPVWVTA